MQMIPLSQRRIAKQTLPTIYASESRGAIGFNSIAMSLFQTQKHLLLGREYGKLLIAFAAHPVPGSIYIGEGRQFRNKMLTGLLKMTYDVPLPAIFQIDTSQAIISQGRSWYPLVPLPAQGPNSRKGYNAPPKTSLQNSLTT